MITFACDFETTVYEGQTHTEVWAASLVELYTENVIVYGSIDDFINYLVNQKQHLRCYFHNLKFDGAFIISYLLKELKYKQAFYTTHTEPFQGEFIDDKEMENNTFKYMISDMGQWYTIKIKTKYGKKIEIRDSLKLLPFTLETIGNSFGTKHKKLKMNYKGLRYKNCKITDEELDYIRNDVLVLKEALELMFEEKHNKLTIGSCCLSEFKKCFCDFDYKNFFPDIYKIEIDNSYGTENAGEYIRKSYKGGWCYLVKGKENKIFKNGVTADVNSLYPSMMSSESGNYYPVGEPHFWKGDIPDEAYTKEHNGQLHYRYFFVRIKTRFYIKENKLPFIQIKNSFLYRENECLETSDAFIDGEYRRMWINPDGTLNDGRKELTLTMTDYYLLLDHYNLEDFEVLDGCWFYAEIGLFDDYMEKYKNMKLNNKGARRELAKLFLNNLYGKLASSTNSSFKYAYIKPDGALGYKTIKEYKKQAGYIPVGTAITSYARNFTIRTAQQNYYGNDKKGFIYADTDSIHCDIDETELKGLTIHDKNFCCWKIESNWSEAYFSRQKTYIEKVKTDNEKEYYDIKCAGMPTKCKRLFNISLLGLEEIKKEMNEEEYNEMFEEMDKDEKEFISKRRFLTDFKTGLKVPGKLIQRNISGGVVLQDTTFEFR